MAFTHLYFRLETVKTQKKVDQLTKRPKTEAKGVAIVEIYLFRSPRVCTARLIPLRILQLWHHVSTNKGTGKEK